MSCSECCKISVSFQLLLSTFKLTLWRCTRSSHCHTTRVPLAVFQISRHRLPCRQDWARHIILTRKIFSLPATRQTMAIGDAGFWTLSSRLFVSNYSGAKLGLLGHSCESISQKRGASYSKQQTRQTSEWKNKTQQNRTAPQKTTKQKIKHFLRSWGNPLAVTDFAVFLLMQLSKRSE